MDKHWVSFHIQENILSYPIQSFDIQPDVLSYPNFKTDIQKIFECLDIYGYLWISMDIFLGRC